MLTAISTVISVAIAVAIAVVVAIVVFGDPLFSFLSLFDPANPVRPSGLAERDRQTTRQQLLLILSRDIDQRLATSLHRQVTLDLSRAEQPQPADLATTEAVPVDISPPPTADIPLLNRVVRSLRRQPAPPRPLAPTHRIVEVFDQADIEGKLLILGEPGSGKTTTLLHLAKDLVERAIGDDNLPIPLILELSTWSQGNTIEQWITQAVETQYDIPAAITQQWLHQDNIVPLLDGLDELGRLNQQAGIDAITRFLGERSRCGLVVCCHRKDDGTGHDPLAALHGAMYGAVSLEPLQPDQIQAYCERLHRPGLWEAIQANSTLLELARKPLFLSMLLVVDQGQAIANETELLDAFMAQQLQAGTSDVYPPDQRPDPDQTRTYLVWLAQQLDRVGATEFLIEELQPRMLSREHNERYVYRLIYGVIYGLSFGLSGELGFGARGLQVGGLVGLLVGLGLGLEPAMQLSRRLVFSVGKACRRGLHVGVRAGLLVGLTVGLVGGLFAGLLAGLLAGVLLLLLVGVSFGLLVGVLVGLISGLSRGLINAKTVPNQGIWRSLQTSITVVVIFGLSFGLGGGLFLGLLFGLYGWLYEDLRQGLVMGFEVGLTQGFGLGLSLGLMHGLIGGPMGEGRFGLNGGLQAAVQHLALRLILTTNGHTPWNYARFLDYAVELRFMQRVGGRYRFIHDVLRAHCAALPLERSKT